MSYEERPLRLCEVCLKVDRAPRHVYGPDPAEYMPDDDTRRLLSARGYSEMELVVAQRDLGDPGTVLRHLDCCLQAGCPDGSCEQLLDDPKHPFDGGKTKDEALVKKLEKVVASMKPEPLVNNQVAVSEVKEL